MFKTLKLIAISACCLIVALPAYAACSSPAGVAGEMGYDVTGTGKYEYCNNTSWIVMHDTASTGPIAHWKLDETSGTTVTDSAGSHNGAMEGGLTGVANSGYSFRYRLHSRPQY